MAELDDGARNAPANRAAAVVLVVAFLGALGAPTVDGLLRSDAARGPEPEMRAPAPRPRAPGSLAALLQWPAAYEQYWRDTFGLRDVLLRGHGALKVFGFGVAPDDHHVIGKELWIFNDHNQILDNWRGTIPLTDTALTAWQHRIERRRNRVRALGADFLFGIAPDKPAIYEDYLPAPYNKVGPSRMDQLYEHLRTHSTADVIDLRPVLRAERVHDRPGDHVYYELGTHWQPRGAIAGFNAMVDHLRPRFPALRNLPLGDHQETVMGGGDTEGRNMYIGDLLPQQKHWFQLKGPLRQQQVLVHEQPHTETWETGDPKLPRVVMFHDSFGASFQQQWAEVCSRLTMVSSYDFDLALIEREHPDLVIEFVVERCLVFQDPGSLTDGEKTPAMQLELDYPEILTVVDADHPGLQGLFGATCHAERAEAQPHLVLDGKGVPDTFAIEGVVGMTRSRLVVHAELDAPRDGEAAVYWRTLMDATWSDSLRVTAAVRAGRNAVDFVLPSLPAAPLIGLVFLPLAGGGTCRLYSLAVRSVGASAGR